METYESRITEKIDIHTHLFADTDCLLQLMDKQGVEKSVMLAMGMDNPDNVYLNAPVNGTNQYEITGQRGTVHYLGFGTQAGNYGSTGNLNTTGSLDAANILKPTLMEIPAWAHRWI